jgi:hypothetical protein
VTGSRATRGIVRFLVAGVLFLNATAVVAQAFSDYQVKAAYFYNFTKFVEWPEPVFADPAAPVRLCVLRDHLFETELIQVTKGKSIRRHAIEVVVVEDMEQSRKCSALFVNSTQQRQNKHLLESLRGSSVLTVGETKEFLQDGGVIAFVLERDKVQFAINRKAATNARLYVSSKMLNLAKRVVN